MNNVPIRDPRLRAYMLLLVPGFVGHTIQLLAEDEPWEGYALQRFWITPGWHLYLPTWAPIAIAVLLGIAALVMGAQGAMGRPRRATLLAVAGLYAAHYLTYPFRIRNHMTTMLSGLVVVSAVWLVAYASGVLRDGKAGQGKDRGRTVDRIAVSGLGVMIAVQYFFAGLHKINTGFLDPDPEGPSAAVSGLTTFWMYGDLGSVPPGWAVVLAIYGTIAIELAAPIVALGIPRLALPTIAILMAFHVPHIACMNVADYPMIASAFYPALVPHAQARRIARHMRPSFATVGGAALGVAVQLWFMPWWGRLTIFGILVLAIWGWLAGAALLSMRAEPRAAVVPSRA